MPRPAHYLDWNATAPLDPAARRAMTAALDLVGNPSSVHGFGRAARRPVEDAREAVAAMVGAPPASVVFTSGGTEANDLALAGSGRPRVLVSAVEHDSVLAVRPDAERLPVDGDGVVRLDALARMLAADPRPALVSVMLANNETGVLQPVEAVARLARAAGAIVHTDAVQGPGRVPVDMGALGVDLMTLSAHKLGGPAGVGALVVSPGVELAARLGGGGQERRRRAGTENLVGIAGFGAAAAAVGERLRAAPRVAALRDRLEAALRAAAPDVVIHGRGVRRLPNTSSIAMPGVAAETQVIAFDLAGVAVSAGAACSSGKVGPSHVLAAMGVPEAAAREAVRVSLGPESGEADVDAFVAAWLALRERSRTARR